MEELITNRENKNKHIELIGIRFSFDYIWQANGSYRNFICWMCIKFNLFDRSINLRDILCLRTYSICQLDGIALLGYILSWWLPWQSYNQFTQEYSIVIAKYLVVANKSRMTHTYIDSGTVCLKPSRKKKQPNNLRNYFNFCVWTLNRIIAIHLISTNEFHLIRSQSQMHERSSDRERKSDWKRKMEKRRERKKVKYDKKWIRNEESRMHILIWHKIPHKRYCIIRMMRYSQEILSIFVSFISNRREIHA